MIPFLTSTAWRAGVAIAAVVLVALMGWRVSTWHRSHMALQATEKALETRSAQLSRCTADAELARLAFVAAAGKARKIEADDRATAERVEHELRTKLDAADAGARDLARRLRDYQVRAGRCTVSTAAGAAGEPDQSAGEPGRDGAVERATEDVFAACARDAGRLAGWQAWWSEVSRSRSIISP